MVSLCLLWGCFTAPDTALPGSGQHCHLPAPCPQHWLFPEARCASLQASAARPCSWGLLAHRRSPCSQKAPTVQGISTGGAAAGCPSRQGAGGFTADHVGRARWDPLPGILWRHFHFYKWESGLWREFLPRIYIFIIHVLSGILNIIASLTSFSQPFCHPTAMVMVCV